MRRLLAIVFALVLLGAACGSDDDSTAASSGGDDTTADYGGGSDTGSEAEAGEYVVTAKDFAFGPDTVELEAGETVTVKNDDGAAHTWTADDGGFDEQLPAGGEVTHTFDEAGTFSYHCEIHPSMTGTITVS